MSGENFSIRNIEDKINTKVRVSTEEAAFCTKMHLTKSLSVAGMVRGRYHKGRSYLFENGYRQLYKRLRCNV